MSDRPQVPCSAPLAGDRIGQPIWPGAWLVSTLVVAAALVGLHVVVDPAAYDVSQLPRLLVLMALLLVAVPATLLTPAVARRLDWRPLGDPLVIDRRDREGALRDCAARYAARLEHYARLAPDNWFNFYDYWGDA
jgi:predicted LPLAT superfamily acyltransferase